MMIQNKIKKRTLVKMMGRDIRGNKKVKLAENTLRYMNNIAKRK